MRSNYRAFVPWAAKLAVLAALDDADRTASTADGGGGKPGRWRVAGTYQLLGLDFMVGQDFRFHFIEANVRIVTHH